MPHALAIATRLSARNTDLSKRRIRFATTIIAATVFLLAATGSASAQLLANGTSGALSVNHGDVITISTGGVTNRDFVGLFLTSAGNGTYVNWFYLNGLKTIPASAIGAATFAFPVGAVASGSYNFRQFRWEPSTSTYTHVATSGVVTVNPEALKVNGVSAPGPVAAEPAASVQVEVSSGLANRQAWIGLFRTGAANNASLDWVYLNGTQSPPNPGLYSATVTMTLPAGGGQYEFRYFSDFNQPSPAATFPVVAEATTPIAGGKSHSLIVRPNGIVRAAGGNNGGQLGDGTTVSRLLPIEVTGVSNVESVAAGGSHSLAISTSGALYAWGANDHGQLGDGTFVQRTAPTLVSLTDVVAVAAGEHHSLALTASGALFAWGMNDQGQLGNGTTTDSSSPVQIATGVIAIGAGSRFSLFVKLNGSVWGMGDNEYGALGDSSNTDRWSPVSMSVGGPAVAVEGGSQYSIVLLKNGTVAATGRNNFGQLGIANWSYRTSAAVISGLTNIVAITAGSEFGLALDRNGAVKGWGNNGYGQLGTATPSFRTSPATVPFSGTMKYVAAGDTHTIGLTGSGVATMFGRNDAGQLGDGTTTDRSTPAVSEAFSERLATPTLSVGSGTYSSEISAVVTSPMAGTVIHYTLNGAEPTESDPTIASGAGISVDHSLSLRVKAWKADWLPSATAVGAYDMRVATPSLSPASGTFTGATPVTAGSATSSVELRYTVDGSTPTASSPQYSAPITIATATVLKVAGFRSGWSGSDVATGSYAMNLGTLAQPTVQPATGSYTASVTVTMSSTQQDAIVRYTVDGTSPTAASPIYSGPITVDGSPTTVKAVAFHVDYTSSTPATREYTLAALAPSITPAAGTYSSAQTVTITGDGPIRFTLDGSEPTVNSPEYVAPLTVSTGATVKAKVVPVNGWSPSTTSSVSLSFNYGQLSAPEPSVPGGIYAETQTVELLALAGASIRYTTDGSEPTAVSNLYVTPIDVSSGTVVVKAKAFHQDWTASSIRSDSYTIDSAAPSIVADEFPAALGAWHNTPITISFACADNVGVVSCSAPTTLSTEGAGQEVEGTAIDQAGRQTALPVTRGLDFTAPVLTISSPVTVSSTTDSSVAISGDVSDSLSGVATVKCNDDAATLIDGELACVVDLHPGLNDIAVVAKDHAGNVASAGIRVTRTGASTALTLSPTAQTILVDEMLTLSLSDDFGADIIAASWVSSDPAVVSVSTDDPPVLTALAPGVITVSATKNGLTAEATLTVIAGASFPDGAERWSVGNRAGYDLGFTINTNRVDPSVPEMFAVDYGPTSFAVRGVSAMGRVASVIEAPGYPLMGDSYGALVAGVNNHPPNSNYGSALDNRYGGYARFAGPASALPWRYDSVDSLGAPAQGPDGTIFAIEKYDTGQANPNGIPIIETQVIVLDGANGTVRAKYPLNRERRGNGCSALSWQAVPTTLGPIVGNDGNGYVVVRSQTTSTGCAGLLSQDVGLSLFRITPTGTVTQVTIYSQHCTREVFGGLSICDEPPVPTELVPDGIGGMLVRATYTTSATWHFSTRQYGTEKRLTRVTDSGVQYDNVVDDEERTLMIGDTGVAFMADQSSVRAVNVTTAAPIWSNSNTLLAPVVARPGGEVAMVNLGTGDLTEFNAAGTPGTSAPFGGTAGYQSAFGLWTSADSGSVTARKSLPLDFARASYGGTGTSQNAPLPPRRHAREDTAAVIMLSFLYPGTRASGVEYSGLVCHEPGGTFLWGNLKIGSSEYAGAIEFEPEQCADGAITVAAAHTHPTQTYRDPATGQVWHNWPDEYPSGFESAVVYHDVKPDDPQRPETVGQQPSDLKIADRTFEGAPGWHHKPNLTWYLASPTHVPTKQITAKPNGATTFIRYKKTALLESKDNLHRYNVTTDTWTPIGAAPWP